MKTKNIYIFEKQESDRFKKFLIDKGWTFQKAASELGISYNYLWKILNGQRNITPDVVMKLREIGFIF